MGQDVRNDSRVCRTPPGPRKIGLSTHTDRREAIVAASLITFLSIAALTTYILWVPPLLPPETPYGFITIDGDTNFSDTALLEGWPGDGSPENPYIIDGLNIVIDWGHLISIRNTRVSFTISNCNLTGGCLNSMYEGAGIYLENVTNSEIVNNICNANSEGIFLFNSTRNVVVNNTWHHNLLCGVVLEYSDYNTVANNTYTHNYRGIQLSESNYNIVENNTVANTFGGIYLGGSDFNTVANNNCSNNGNHGISLEDSNSNTLVKNICNGNGNHGISLESSDSNTVANNICNYNNVHDEDFGDGIYLYDSGTNTVVNNTCNGNRFGIYIGGTCGWPNIVADNICLDNTENDISDEFLSEVLLSTMFVGFLGFIGITIVGGLIVGNHVSKGE